MADYEGSKDMVVNKRDNVGKLRSHSTQRDKLLCWKLV